MRLPTRNLLAAGALQHIRHSMYMSFCNTSKTVTNTSFLIFSGIEGQLYNYILNSTSAEYLIIQIDATGKGGVLATITDAPAAYIHSVFSTEHYVILIVWQCDLGKRTPKPTYNTVGTIKEWDPSRKALFCKLEPTPCRCCNC